MMQMTQRSISRSNLSARTTVVNLLEALYILTAIALLGAGVQFARKNRTAARHLLWLGILGAGVSILLYWFLRPSA